MRKSIVIGTSVISVVVLILGLSIGLGSRSSKNRLTLKELDSNFTFGTSGENSIWSWKTQDIVNTKKPKYIVGKLGNYNCNIKGVAYGNMWVSNGLVYSDSYEFESINKALSINKLESSVNWNIGNSETLLTQNFSQHEIGSDGPTSTKVESDRVLKKNSVGLIFKESLVKKANLINTYYFTFSLSEALGLNFESAYMKARTDLFKDFFKSDINLKAFY